MDIGCRINSEDIVKKIGKIRVEGNRRVRGRPKKKWMEVVGEDTRACGVDKDTVRDRVKGKNTSGAEAKVQKKKTLSDCGSH